MKRTKFIFALLLGLANVALADHTPTLPSTNLTGQTYCAVLPSPTSLDLFSVSPTTITYTWPTVSGAVAFHLVTKEVATGNIVDVQTISAAVIPKATVLNLVPNTAYQTSIQSVDNNGVYSEPATYAAPVHTLIFEIVASLYPSYNGPNLNCEMGFTPETGGPYTTDGSFTYYRVANTKNMETKVFRVNVTSFPTTNVDPNLLPSNFQFSLTPPFNDHILIKYLNTPVVSLTTNLQTSPSNIKLYRDGISNDPGFKVYYLGCNPLQDPGSDDRMLGSDGSSFGQGLSANPNPFSNELDITLPFSNETQDIYISLYDLQGRQVLNQSLPGGTQMLKLFTGDITPGLYFLRAQSGEMSEIIRVLKTQ